MEHNTAAVCGIWWHADVCIDGTPQGYGVYEVDGNQVKWYYKSAGHPKDYQFRSYAAGTSKEFPKDIIANVWNWDKNWKVEWLENGKVMGTMTQYTGVDEVQEIQKENAELKKQNEQLKQVCADTGEMISNFKKETEKLQKQKKLLIGVVNTLMEKCMGVTAETQDIQTKKSLFGRVKGLTWERWQRILNAVIALGATVQACNRTLKAQPKAAVEKKKSIRVQLQEIKEKHGTRD